MHQPESWSSQHRTLSFSERLIAYSSTESGTFEVWLQPFPAGSGVKHRITQNGRAMPVWSSDGGELFYRPSPPGTAGALFSIELTTEPRFAFTTARSVPAGDFVAEGGSRDYDITPDGQALLVVVHANEDAASLQINVVLNWFEELKARVPLP